MNPDDAALTRIQAMNDYATAAAADQKAQDHAAHMRDRTEGYEDGHTMPDPGKQSAEELLRIARAINAYRSARKAAESARAKMVEAWKAVLDAVRVEEEAKAAEPRRA